MNKNQRELLSRIGDEIQTLIDEEETKLDNMYDFKDTQKYQDMEETKSELQEVLELVENILNK